MLRLRVYLREQHGELSGHCDATLQFCAKAVETTAKAASIDERTIMLYVRRCCGYPKELGNYKSSTASERDALDRMKIAGSASASDQCVSAIEQKGLRYEIRCRGTGIPAIDLVPLLIDVMPSMEMFSLSRIDGWLMEEDCDGYLSLTGDQKGWFDIN